MSGSGFFKISGCAGSGKSTICEKLLEMGYYSIDADDHSCCFDKAGNVVDKSSDWENLNWDVPETLLLYLKELSKSKYVFLCGSNRLELSS